MRAGSWFGFLGTMALAGLPAPADAQPVGSEFQINTYTPNNQSLPSVASDASGNFVVVWGSNYQDGDNLGVFSQRYDSAGGALGSEFRVNSYTTNRQDAQSVASDASGNFVVVWQSFGQDGFFDGIFGQRYDSAGVAQGSEFRVNSYTTNSQDAPSVASDASGNFVVVWQSFGQDGSDDGIFGQRYDSMGEAQGAEFRVNTFTNNNQRVPSVASDASGNFVVVWYSEGQDGSIYGVFGQRYDSAGVAQGSEFRVNTYTFGIQRFPSATSDPSGSFVVAWNSSYGSGYNIFGQRYDSGGAPQGAEFRINTYTTDDQTTPSVAATGTDAFAVVWTSDGQDGSGAGVFGQRYDFSGTPSITVLNPNTNVKWRIGSQQKIQWTHNLGHRATFRIELDRDDDGEYEELIAAAAPSDSTRGSFAWTVTGPPSGTARVRVSWTDDLSVSDASDVTFQIRPN